MLSVFQSPGRYTQGENATRELGNELKQIGLGGPALVLASASPQKLLADTWKQAFADAGIDYRVETFGGQCTLDEISRVGAAARDFGAQVIVGVGGGKALDTARAVAAELGLAIVNCPSVASSDAPCSALSVIYTNDDKFDEYRFYKANPDLVLVDTAAIAKAPARLLVAGIGDALATWWEAKTVREARMPNQLHGAPTHTGTALAKLCYDLLIENATAAVTACNQGVVTPALDALVEANTLLSGLGFESGGLAAAHSLYNGLTAIDDTHGYMHGEMVSFGLVMQLVLEGRPRADFDEVVEFAISVGLPVTLAEVGVTKITDDKLMTVAERAVQEGETIHHEPFEVTAEDVAQAMVAADALGREALAAA